MRINSQQAKSHKDKLMSLRLTRQSNTHVDFRTVLRSVQINNTLTPGRISFVTRNENRFPKISSEVKFWDYVGDVGGRARSRGRRGASNFFSDKFASTTAIIITVLFLT